MSGYNPEFQREIDEIVSRLDGNDAPDGDPVAGIVVSILIGLMVWVAIGLVIWP